MKIPFSAASLPSRKKAGISEKATVFLLQSVLPSDSFWACPTLVDSFGLIYWSGNKTIYSATLQCFLYLRAGCTTWFTLAQTSSTGSFTPKNFPLLSDTRAMTVLGLGRKTRKAGESCATSPSSFCSSMAMYWYLAFTWSWTITSFLRSLLWQLKTCQIHWPSPLP